MSMAMIAMVKKGQSNGYAAEYVGEIVTEGCLGSIQFDILRGTRLRLQGMEPVATPQLPGRGLTRLSSSPSSLRTQVSLLPSTRL